VSTLVPSGPPTEDIGELRARVAERETALAERAAEVERLDADLTLFAAQYRHHVGTLHEQLDQLYLDIADAELGILAARPEAEQKPDTERQPSPPPPDAPSAPRLTSDAVRKLFRDVAKAIHPDLARDEAARDRRHTLMIEANRAYASGDEEQLRIILQAWENSPEAVVGSDPEAMRVRLMRRIGQIEEEIDMLGGDLIELQDSPLGKLKAMVDEAAAQGKDLVRDMIGRLKRDILVATNRLDAISPPGEANRC